MIVTGNTNAEYVAVFEVTDVPPLGYAIYTSKTNNEDYLGGFILNDIVSISCLEYTQQSSVINNIKEDVAISNKVSNVFIMILLYY